MYSFFNRESFRAKAQGLKMKNEKLKAFLTMTDIRFSTKESFRGEAKS